MNQANINILLWLALLASVSAYQAPKTTGSYATGVHDFEFTDTEYVSDFAFDAQGRRILARAIYPVCEKIDVVIEEDGSATCQSSGSISTLGRRREYFEPGEWEASFWGEPEPTNITDTFSLTHSYIDAPPIAGASGQFPVVIYTHGLGMWMNDNTALLEEIVSQGYTVFAIGSPGFCGGLLFTNTMDIVTPMDYPEIGLTMEQAIIMQNETWSTLLVGGTQARHDAIEAFLSSGTGLSSMIHRVRDDQVALADYLEMQHATGDRQNSLMQQILAKSAGLDALVYMGFSMGGSAAGSTAQVDPRAVGVINMDGIHLSLDLFGKASRVPYMNMWGNDGFLPYYDNEFFFEPLETMGSNPNVTRIGMVADHQDLSDFRHTSQIVRQMNGLNFTVDGDLVLEILTEFTVGFLDTYLKGQSGWDPTASFDMFPDVESVDVTYVAEWKLEEEAEADGELENEPTPPLGSEPLVLESASSIGAKTMGWVGLVLAACGTLLL